jgi:hypothetical protein
MVSTRSATRRRPALRCDIDHTIAFADGGRTYASSLKCLCRLHHGDAQCGGPPCTVQCSRSQVCTAPSFGTRSSVRPAPMKSSSPAPCVIWSLARARASRIVAASSCVACPASGNCRRSIATAPGRDRPRRNWCQHPLPGLGPRCAARTAPLPRWPGGHRGFSAEWHASSRPPTADEKRYVEPQRGYALTLCHSDRCNVNARCQTGLGLES